MIAALQIIVPRLAWLAVALAAPTGLAHASDITQFDGARVAAIAHAGAENAPLANAAALLARDLSALTGRTPEISSSPSGGTIIIGIANDPAIAALLAANQIDAGPIAGKWEAYGRAVIRAPGPAKGKALLIFGSDVRGAIWGVMDLSREMGVSPWEWWADVKIRPVKKIRVDGALRFSREPSVKYRAIFLNDEDYGLFVPSGARARVNRRREEQAMPDANRREVLRAAAGAATEAGLGSSVVGRDPCQGRQQIVGDAEASKLMASP